MRHRTIWLWTLLALVFSLISPAAQAAWQCEGRTCGTSLWFCCCAAPQAERDANCEDRSGSRERGAGTACAAKCECTLTVRTLDAERRSPGLSAAPDFHPVLLLPAVQILPSFPAEQAARPIESRGPPPRPASLPAAGLRGPPSLTSLFIGC